MSDEYQYKIDLGRIYSVDEFQDVLKENLPLPEYYGGTLDALYDVLTDEGRDFLKIIQIHMNGVLNNPSWLAFFKEMTGLEINNECNRN